MCFAIIKYSFILHNTDAINKEYRAGLNFISGDKKLSTLNDNQLMVNKTIDTEECINSMHFVV